MKEPCPVTSVTTKFGCKGQKMQSNRVPLTRKKVMFLSLKRSPEVGSLVGLSGP